MNKTRVDLNIKLNDLVTFQSCSTLVSSIIKYLIYQRHQIPYTFEVLKYLVKRRNELVTNDSEEEQCEISRHDRLTVEREFNKALDVYEAIDSVLREIENAETFEDGCGENVEKLLIEDHGYDVTKQSVHALEIQEIENAETFEDGCEENVDKLLIEDNGYDVTKQSIHALEIQEIENAETFEDGCEENVDKLLIEDNGYDVTKQSIHALEIQHIDSELHSLSPEHNIQEIVIIFGTTALHPKNVFRIVVPSVDYSHSDLSHPPQKLLNCLFRSMMTSDELNTILDHQMCPTNTFILMKTDRNTTIKSDVFHQKDHFRIPAKSVGLKFVFTSDIRTEDKKCCCVEDMSFFFCSPKQSDSTTNNRLCHDHPKLETIDLIEGEDDSDSENSNWFQFNYVIKGFKDYKLNGSSVTNLWMKYASKQVNDS